MSAPEVRVQEIDLSTRVPGFPGVYGGIVLPTVKGPVDKPQLVTSDTDLLRKFTLKEAVPIDGNDAFFSALAFLQKSDKLWVKRCAGAGALTGGANFVSTGDEETQAENKGFTKGIMDTSYVSVADKKLVLFAQNPGSWNNDIKIKLFRQRPIESVVSEYPGDTSAGSDSVENPINIEGFKIACKQDWQDGEPVRIAAASDELEGGVAVKSYRIPGGLNASGVFYVVKEDEKYAGGKWTSTIRLATSYSKAKAAAAARDKGNSTEYKANVVKLSRRTEENITLTSNLSQFTGDTVIPIKTVSAPGWVTGEAVFVEAKQGAFPTGTPEILYVIRTGVDSIQLAANKDDALAGIPYTSEQTGGTATKITITELQGIKILPVKNTKTPNTCLLEVFSGEDEENPVETYVFAREAGRKNADGKNIFLDTILSSSAYIRGKANSADVNPDDTFDAETGKWLTDCPATVVKVQGIALPISGGDDGGLVSDGDMIRASEAFLNQESYPLTVLMDGGYTSVAYQQQLLAIAEARKDCVAILSTPEDSENASDYLNSIVDFKMSQLNPNTSYGALYTPHVQVYDRYNNVERWVAPDGYAAAAISYTAYNYEMWYPVGGFRRGVINVKDTNRRFTKGEMDYLYDNGINPIRFYPNKGIVIWGQKTLSARPSALDRLNVRLMLIVIEPACATALEDFLFELNDEATRGIIRAMLESYMDNIKARRGVYDYQVVCDDSNNSPDDIDNYRLNVWLFVKPTKAIEYIPFKVVITSTGMDFSLAAQSV
jgi:hypothetical protein